MARIFFSHDRTGNRSTLRTAFTNMLALCLVTGVGGLPLRADEEESTVRADYVAFSKLVHGMIVKNMPKDFEEKSMWGQTVPLPPKLILPQRRTYIKEGDEWRLPHGPWLKVKGNVADPAKDLTIAIRDFQPVDEKNYKLALDGGAIIALNIEWQQWQKGLKLIDTKTDAEVKVRVGVNCDVATELQLLMFPPQVELKPKVNELTVDVVDFSLKPPIPLLQGPRGQELRDLVKDMLRTAVKSQEPAIKTAVNQAIADGFRNGKGKMSASELLKALPKTKTPKK